MGGNNIKHIMKLNTFSLFILMALIAIGLTQNPCNVTGCQTCNPDNLTCSGCQPEYAYVSNTQCSPCGAGQTSGGGTQASCTNCQTGCTACTTPSGT